MVSTVFIKQTGNGGAAVKAGNHASQKQGGAAAAAGGGGNTQSGFNTFLQDGGLDSVFDNRSGVAFIADVRDAYAARHPGVNDASVTRFLGEAQAQGRIQLLGDDVSGLDRRYVTRGYRPDPNMNVRVYVLKRENINRPADEN